MGTGRARSILLAVAPRKTESALGPAGWSRSASLPRRPSPGLDGVFDRAALRNDAVDLAGQRGLGPGQQLPSAGFAARAAASGSAESRATSESDAQFQSAPSGRMEGDVQQSSAPARLPTPTVIRVIGSVRR